MTPTTAAECPTCYHNSLPGYLCYNCADTYARQRVEAFRERAAGKALEFDAPGGVHSGRRTATHIAAAIRALEP